MKKQAFDAALWDVEFPIHKTNSRIFPLSEGAKLHDFSFERMWCSASSGLVSKQRDSFLNYCKKGIRVISFLTPGWSHYAENHLSRLIKSNEEIRALGGEICLFVNSESEEAIRFFLKDYEIPFSIGIDNDFTIARKFGVFDENHQPWHSIAGISEDGPFPSIFILKRNAEVAYSYVDLTFENPFSYVQVAASVYNESQKQVWHSFERNLLAITN